MSFCFEQSGSHMLSLNTAVSERTRGWRRNLEPRATWCSLLDNGMWNWPHHICVSSLLLLTLPISHVTTNYRLQHVPTHADTHPLFSLSLDGIYVHTWNGIHACLNPHLNRKSARTSDKVHFPPLCCLACTLWFIVVINYSTSSAFRWQIIHTSRL